MADVEMRQVKKSYGDVQIIHGVDLSIESGEFVVFVGPSGCGKSTLLRMIAGLEDITSGDLIIGGLRANKLAPAKRSVGMVFQSYALYPHMSVYDNMAFGLTLAKEDKDEVKTRVMRARRSCNSIRLLTRKPKGSGGQRQRVAIRPIVRKPKVFLFDEPCPTLTRRCGANAHRDCQAALRHESYHGLCHPRSSGGDDAMNKIVVLNKGNGAVGAPLERITTHATCSLPGHRFSKDELHRLPASQGRGRRGVVSTPGCADIRVAVDASGAKVETT